MASWLNGYSANSEISDLPETVSYPNLQNLPVPSDTASPSEQAPTTTDSTQAPANPPADTHIQEDSALVDNNQVNDAPQGNRRARRQNVVSKKSVKKKTDNATTAHR